MTSSPLDNLVRIGPLKAEPPVQAEFDGLVRSGWVGEPLSGVPDPDAHAVPGHCPVAHTRSGASQAQPGRVRGRSGCERGVGGGHCPCRAGGGRASRGARTRATTVIPTRTSVTKSLYSGGPADRDGILARQSLTVSDVFWVIKAVYCPLRSAF